MHKKQTSHWRPSHVQPTRISVHCENPSPFSVVNVTFELENSACTSPNTANVNFCFWNAFHVKGACAQWNCLEEISACAYTICRLPNGKQMQYLSHTLQHWKDSCECWIANHSDFIPWGKREALAQGSNWRKPNTSNQQKSLNINIVNRANEQHHLVPLQIAQTKIEHIRGQTWAEHGSEF